MTALPSLDKCGLQGTGHSIWNNLLKAESTALGRLKDDKAKYEDPLIGIRVLGFFLKDFWDHAQDSYLGSTPYDRIVLEITSCLNKPDDEAIQNALVALGLRYRNYLLRMFRSTTGGRLSVSRHYSRPSIDVIKGRILEELGKAPQTKKNIKKQALLRDGYRYAISQIYDRKFCNDIFEIKAAVMALDNPFAMETEVAHIFPESAQDGDEDYAATVFAILEMFGREDKVKALRGGQINGLHNVITMVGALHSAFDSFELWLEPVAVHGQENTYDVCWKGLPVLPVPIPSRVTFTVEPSAVAAAEAANKELKLPDPVLIAIRAACTRVANLSGAAEHAERLERDLEDMTVLAEDGGMAGLLAARLSTAAPRFFDEHFETPEPPSFDRPYSP